MKIDSKAIDFVLTFPQANLDTPVYMEIPVHMELKGSHMKSKTHVLKLRKSLSVYGLKQAGLNLHLKLKKALEDGGYVEALSDPCVFLKKKIIILVCVDDCIIISKSAELIDEFINLSLTPRKFCIHS